MFACLTAADLNPIEMPTPDDDGDPVSVEAPAAVQGPSRWAWLVLDADGMRIEPMEPVREAA